jgi:multiple sugar transport system substrate-binding protein
MSVRHRRLAYLIFAVACVAMAVTASFAGATTAKKTDGNLVIMGWGASGDDVKVTRIALAEKAVNANITNPSGGFNDQQFLAAIASGSVPDLVYMPREKVATYASKGALQPLTSCISQEHINMKQFRASSVQEATYAGKVYGLPEFTNPRTIVVDQSVVKNAGLTNADLSTKNWTKLRQASQKMTANAGGNLTRIGFDPKIDSTFGLPLWAKINGANILSKDGKKANLADPKVIAALQFAVQLINDQGGWGKFKAFRDTWDFFGSGNQVVKDQVGAWPMEQFYFATLQQVSPKVDVAALPIVNKKGGPITFLTGSAWVIPKGAKNFANACKYAATVVSTDAWLAAAKARIATLHGRGQGFSGIFTANTDADVKIYNTYANTNNQDAFDKAYKANLDIQRYGFILPPSAGGFEFQTAYMDAVNKVLAGQASPAQALKDAQKTAQAALNAAYKNASVK